MVILPAFGVSTDELKILKRRGSALVDTTCGSVRNVWKNVERNARAGYTSIVHGKHWHQETKATISRVEPSVDGGEPVGVAVILHEDLDPRPFWDHHV